MKLLYFFYCIIKTDKEKFSLFLTQASRNYHIPKMKIVADILFCLVKYETFPMDYFYYRFIELSAEERSKYTSRLLMYRFHRKYNNQKDKEIFRNKIIFHDKFKDFVKHKSWNLLHNTTLNSLLDWIDKEKPAKIVLKNPIGQAGRAVMIIEITYSFENALVSSTPIRECLIKMIQEKYYLAEEYVYQHKIFYDLFPPALNTVRITTFLYPSGAVELLYATIRMGFNRSVDNFDAGGISALIDLEKGIVKYPGIFKAPFQSNNLEKHPKTNYPILGLTIPYWEQIISMVKSAAIVVPSVKTVGWDVIIRDTGPALLEGNDNWDKTHWECCEGKGMKRIILTLYNNN